MSIYLLKDHLVLSIELIEHNYPLSAPRANVRNVSVINSLLKPISIIISVDKIKLSCDTFLLLNSPVSFETYPLCSLIHCFWQKRVAFIFSCSSKKKITIKAHFSNQIKE